MRTRKGMGDTRREDEHAEAIPEKSKQPTRAKRTSFLFAIIEKRKLEQISRERRRQQSV
jgi:hypothetical protein